MSKNVYCVEYGCLLNKTDEEYENYTGVYGTRDYGFYDECMTPLVVEDNDKSELAEQGRLSIDELHSYYGYDNCYCVITYQGKDDDYYDIDDEDFMFDTDEIDFSKNAVAYSVAMINGEIVENFI